jgi:CubicO group peptidase (beta-lactamase class C family)
MLRKIAKGIGYLILLIIVGIGGFVAFNWTMVSNAVVEKFAPTAAVKGCNGADFPQNPGALPAASFAAMKAYSDKHDGVGLIVLVNGAVAGEAYRPGASAATRTASQSMHKTVVGMMMGAAIADGAITSIDDPVGKYLTEWANDPRGKIPLRAFLTMSSGIRNPSMAKGELQAFNLMLGDVTGAAMDAEIEQAPGTFSYQNIDYQIAGMAMARAVEKAGKGDYASWLSARLWCPIGNANATLWLDEEGGNPRYFASLDASVRDWARVGELIRMNGAWSDKQLIPAAHMAQFIAPSAGNPAYGLGIWRGSPWVKDRRYSKHWNFGVLHSAPYRADDVLYLDGYGGQRVYIVPSAGLVIARAGESSQAWDDAILVNLALEGLGK